ncbi:hypothetical protein NDU88_000916 [Pleurodeles waltl]|uniref:Uncharacterized protein n=1 Tax=Pleurodeles waltl TaxID=8319 RepID=A0AAV7NIM2_PLEWA|nr:hypothetical protein NDU88_000916 [Pleurodeles waltl]
MPPRQSHIPVQRRNVTRDHDSGHDRLLLGLTLATEILRSTRKRCRKRCAVSNLLNSRTVLHGVRGGCAWTHETLAPKNVVVHSAAPPSDSPPGVQVRERELPATACDEAN